MTQQLDASDPLAATYDTVLTELTYERSLFDALFSPSAARCHP